MTTNINEAKRDLNAKTSEIYSETKNKVKDVIAEESNRVNKAYEQVKDSAEDIYESVKDSAEQIYKAGKKKLGQSQDIVQDYSEDLVKTIKERPLTSLLVAGGVGALLSLLLRK